MAAVGTRNTGVHALGNPGYDNRQSMNPFRNPTIAEEEEESHMPAQKDIVVNLDAAPRINKRHTTFAENLNQGPHSRSIYGGSNVEATLPLPPQRDGKFQRFSSKADQRKRHTAMPASNMPGFGSDEDEGRNSPAPSESTLVEEDHGHSPSRAQLRPNAGQIRNRRLGTVSQRLSMASKKTVSTAGKNVSIPLQNFFGIGTISLAYGPEEYGYDSYESAAAGYPGTCYSTYNAPNIPTHAPPPATRAPNRHQMPARATSDYITDAQLDRDDFDMKRQKTIPQAKKMTGWKEKARYSWLVLMVGKDNVDHWERQEQQREAEPLGSLLPDDRR